MQNGQSYTKTSNLHYFMSNCCKKYRSPHETIGSVLSPVFGSTVLAQSGLEVTKSSVRGESIVTVMSYRNFEIRVPESRLCATLSCVITYAVYFCAGTRVLQGVLPDLLPQPDPNVRPLQAHRLQQGFGEARRVGTSTQRKPDGAALHTCPGTRPIVNTCAHTG